MLRQFKVLYNTVTDSNNGGGGSNVPTPPTPNAPPPQAQGTPQFDSLGYPLPPTPPTPPPQGTPPATPPTPPVEANAGYNTPPPPPNVAGYVDPATPPAPAPPATPAAVELVDMKDLSDADKKVWGDYFTENKIPKEAQSKLVEIRKNEILANQQAEAAKEKQIQDEVARLKSTWFEELKSDKDFGGGNFDSSIKMVNRFINDFLPNTKKVLTEKGGMLPPSTMKDFHNVAKKLYETEGFVQGDGPGASGQTPNKWGFLSELYPNNK